MQQLYILEPGKVEWQEDDALVLHGPQEALVRPLAVSICDADVNILRGHVVAPFPFALGHETMGEVIDVGEGVTHFSVGDRVIVPSLISCGCCVPCRRGHTSACSTGERSEFYGQILGHPGYGLGEVMGSYGGAIGDAVRVPYADAMLVPVPSGVVGAQVAAAAENMSSAYGMVAPALEREPGANVLVVVGSHGGRSIGLYSAAIALALGASEVDFLSSDEDLLEKASRLGARPIHREKPADKVGRYRITVDASANPKWLATAIRSTDSYGTCASAGIYLGDVKFPLGNAFHQGLHLQIGWANARTDIPGILKLVQNGLDLSAIHTVVPWDSAVDALQGPLPHKLVLER